MCDECLIAGLLDWTRQKADSKNHAQDLNKTYFLPS